MHKKQYLVSVSLSVVLFVLSVYSFNSQAVETDADKSLANYTPVLSADFKELLNSADLAAGEEFFMRKCSSCHDAVKSDIHGKGPNLWNVFGRKAGIAKGFEYSDAMRQSGHTWNYATLNYYLTRTDRAVPGRIMNFRGIRKDAYRAKLLLFLRSMNDNPPPLP
ncbi:MAG: c-type cytochrome [gamma proteobacterium symbiont of Lucinoma myriamae]|nr:c-type cytochrome [gamma proteobacterium symbiont of Lucinoma myriamae]MCU7819519.1 c-type cytochrome [gamma proteobacterium symbiont of Lucinoma myriamae]MCU7833320.1 c-type cytochrome [gamma proteobacterium symbiont of Lucinoma myriamae]